MPVVVVSGCNQHRKGQLAELFGQETSRILSRAQFLVEITPDGEGIHLELPGQFDQVLKCPAQSSSAALRRRLAQTSKDGVEVHIGAMEQSHQLQYVPLGHPPGTFFPPRKTRRLESVPPT